MGGSGETAAQRASRLLTSGGRTGRTRTGCRNTKAREFLGRARGTIRLFEHSPVEALALSEIVVPEDVASRNLTQDVVTRWGSTYLALCRLYTMWPRLSVFFRSTSLSAGQRKRKLLNRDWDVLRQLIAVLSPAFEVTKASEKSAATLAEIFFFVVALRKTMLEDALNVPMFPELPLAVGGAAIETYIDEYPDDAVIEIDGRLYPCVLTFVDETPGRECLDEEARTAVYVLRDEIDRLYFNTLDNSKNWLKNTHPVKTGRCESYGFSTRFRTIRTFYWTIIHCPLQERQGIGQYNKYYNYSALLGVSSLSPRSFRAALCARPFCSV